MSGSVEVPQPPEDQELRNIIDKLAQFVARNGPEFENMTKQKQKGNPKFAFLFGGEFYHYYQYKMTAEQAVMRKQQLQQHQQRVQGGGFAMPSTPEIQSLKDKISESERNLKAQYEALMQQKQREIDEAIAAAVIAKVDRETAQCLLPIPEFNKVLESLKDSCSKDGVANSKAWILTHCHSEKHARAIMMHLLRSVRKNVAPLNAAISAFIPQMYSFTILNINPPDDQSKERLQKLLALWEEKKYLDEGVIDKLKSPIKTMQTEHTQLIAEFPQIVGEISTRIMSQYAQYEKQHEDFVKHVELQVSQLSSQYQQQQFSSSGLPSLMDLNMASSGVQSQSGNTQTARRSRFDTGPPGMNIGQPGLMQNIPPPGQAASGSFGGLNHQGRPLLGHGPPLPWNPQSPMGGPSHFGQFGPPPFPPHSGPGQPPWSSGAGGGPPPPPPFRGVGPRGPLLPMPPGRPPLLAGHGIMPPGPLDEHRLIPTALYYDLPAGLMVPLVKMVDCDYEPIEPTEIRLPPPTPPSERLLAAVEAFYSPPNHENPRDSEGWEKLGLFEYYKSKEEACKSLPTKPARPDRIIVDTPPPSPKEGGEENKDTTDNNSIRSRSNSPASNHNTRKPKSRSGSRSMSKSPSPPPGQRKSRFDRSADSPTSAKGASGKGSQRKSRSSSGSGSGSRSRSWSPTQHQPRRRKASRSPSPSPLVGYRRSNSRSQSRSPTPPHLRSSAGGGVYTSDGRLDENNKGHQLLKKMGWGGRGLGAEEQGIQEPVSGGEVRERADQYKGLGVTPTAADPFEQFRKAKAGQYVQTLRSGK